MNFREMKQHVSQVTGFTTTEASDGMLDMLVVLTEGTTATRKFSGPAGDITIGVRMDSPVDYWWVSTRKLLQKIP